MKSQAQISTVLDSQKEQVVKKAKGISRYRKNELALIENFACIITGIRRCGKSTLMLQLIDNCETDFLYLNFEDMWLILFLLSIIL